MKVRIRKIPLMEYLLSGLQDSPFAGRTWEVDYGSHGSCLHFDLAGAFACFDAVRRDHLNPTAALAAFESKVIQ
jgi:hypothetical protein